MLAGELEQEPVLGADLRNANVDTRITRLRRNIKKVDGRKYYKHTLNLWHEFCEMFCYTNQNESIHILGEGEKGRRRGVITNLGFNHG